MLKHFLCALVCVKEIRKVGLRKKKVLVAEAEVEMLLVYDARLIGQFHCELSVPIFPFNRA